MISIRFIVIIAWDAVVDVEQVIFTEGSHKIQIDKVCSTQPFEHEEAHLKKKKKKTVAIIDKKREEILITTLFMNKVLKKPEKLFLLAISKILFFVIQEL